MSNSGDNGTMTRRTWPAWIPRRWALPLLAAVVVSGIGIVSFREVDRSAVKNVDAKITTILEAAVKALTIWTDEQRRNATYIAEQDAIREDVAALVSRTSTHATKTQLAEAPEQKRLAEVLTIAMHSYGYVDYVVLDRAGRILVDGVALYVGEQAPPTWNEVLPIIFSGKAAVARPHRRSIQQSEAPTERRATDSLMFVAAPIREESGDVIAAVAFGIEPERQFTDIMTVARAGDTGETFAFDEEGWILSDSRFDDQLKAIGLLRAKPDATAVLNVRLVEPDTNVDGDNPPWWCRRRVRLPRSSPPR